MYVPAYFEPPGDEAMVALMRARPLATVVVHGAAGLVANHIPLEFFEGIGPHGVLRGHVARANPLWQEVSSGLAALAVFQGPDHYVSPTWYPTKREHGRVVPTWNYCVVHAHGSLRAVEDDVWLAELLTRLTEVNERAMPAPWHVDDAPAEFIERMRSAVVGIELCISRLEGKWKVSQNQPANNRAGVVDALRGGGSDHARAMADLVAGKPA